MQKITKKLEETTIQKRGSQVTEEHNARPEASKDDLRKKQSGNTEATYTGSNDTQVG